MKYKNHLVIYARYSDGSVGNSNSYMKNIVYFVGLAYIINVLEDYEI